MPNQFHPTSQDESVFDLVDLFTHLWHKKFRVIFIASIILVGLGYYIVGLPKIYRASGTILLGDKKQNVDVTSIGNNSSSSADNKIETYVEFIRSRQFMGAIVDELNLTDFREFRSKSVSASEERHRDYAIGVLLGNLGLSQLGDTYLLKVSYESLTPQVAADVANAIGPAFFAFNLDMNLKRADEASLWLNGQIDGVQSKLSAAEQDLQNYLEENRLTDVDSQIELIKLEISSLLVLKLENEKDMSEVFSALQQVRLNKDDPESLLKIPKLLDHPQVLDIRVRMVAQIQELAELSKRYKSKHHKFIATKTRLLALETELEELLVELIDGVEQEYTNLVSRDRGLEEQIERAKVEHRELGNHELQIKRLRRAVNSIQKIYEIFLSRLQETEILRDLGQSEEFAVVDVASVPRSPAKPRVTLLLVFAAIFSTLVSSIFWLTLHFISDKKTRYTKLLHKNGVSVLAEIPKMKKVSKKKSKEPKKKSMGAFSGDDALYSEAIRTLRSEIMVRSNDITIRTIAVTGIQQGNKTSQVGMALAESFGFMEKSIIVDCNMRNPHVGINYGIDQLSPGLSNFISRRVSFSEATFKQSSSQLTVMPSGVLPSDPLVHISKPRFAGFIKKLSVLYERVILETPHVNLHNDALVISKLADGVILLCDLEKTDSAELLEAVTRIQDVGVPLLGVVFENAKNVKSNIPKRSVGKLLVKKVTGY